MIENHNIIRLQEMLESLMIRQDSFQREIGELRDEIARLKLQDIETEIIAPSQKSTSEYPSHEIGDQTVGQEVVEPIPLLEQIISSNDNPVPQQILQPEMSPGDHKRWSIKSDLEKFVGENLLNKIGIAITVIGVGIGAKYAIDHDLISPWTRIILGYLVGMGLLGFAFHLKKQYLNFSAVLLSGSMAILYLLTYAAFAFYNLMPLWLTFTLMVIITVMTVAAALIYNQQVIAHIGLVGAYAVPFLLSNHSGNIAILFSYMALINTGILVIAVKKYWKSLYYSSFVITWLVVVAWYFESYLPHDHFRIAFVFFSVFFAQFYSIFLTYKLLKKELFSIEDILMILGNSAVFYGLGYAVLQSHDTGETILGLFSLGNALVHFLVCMIIYRQKQADQNLLYFTAGLALVFLTIAIPVGLNGHWVTLLWSAEVAILFWIGRSKSTAVYELLSYPLMFLAFFSLINDWICHYHFFGNEETVARIVPIFNPTFLTSLLFIAALLFVNILNIKKEYISPVKTRKWLIDMMTIFMPALLLIALYALFIMEISTFWNQMYLDSTITLDKNLTVPQHIRNVNIIKYNTLSIINYTLLFLSILSLINIRKLKNSLLGSINLGFNVIALGIFLTIGLYTIGELRDSYLSETNAGYFYHGGFNIGIRYISFLFVGLMLFSANKYIYQKIIEMDLTIEFDFVLQITLLTLASNELINWMDIARSEQSYKLGLSILWGVYALLLIVYGIWKKKKHLRIGAIALFAITLIKLFFYDISYLDTISKTIVFVSLGLLLLIISFLYNKYKKLIF